jgi:hypothetical protein
MVTNCDHKSKVYEYNKNARNPPSGLKLRRRAIWKKDGKAYVCRRVKDWYQNFSPAWCKIDP